MGGIDITPAEAEISADAEIIKTGTLSFELPDLTITDFLQAFLEEHGHKMTEDHEGNPVPYNTAVYTCPALPKLIRAFGESVLSMTASRQSVEQSEEQKDEAKPDETETATQTQDESSRAPDTHSEKEEGQTGRTTDTGDGPLSEASIQTNPVEIAGGNLDAGASHPELTAVTTVKESVISHVVPIKTSKLSKPLTSDTTPQSIDKPQKKVSQFKAEVRMPLEAGIEETDKPVVNTEPDTPGIKGPDAPTAEILKARHFEQLVITQTENTPNVSEKDEIENTDKESPVTGFIDAKLEIVEDNTLPDLLEFRTLKEEICTSEKGDDESVSLMQNGVDRLSEMVSSSEWAEDGRVDVFSESLKAEELLRVEAEQPAYDFIQFETPEPTLELSLPVEEMEDTVQQLAERIETLDDGESQAVFNILDNITAKSEEIAFGPYDTEDQEQAIDIQEDKAEELKELFIELFDQLEVEYTPELLESFAKLALRGHMAEITEAIEANEGNEVMPDRGTHEAITKLLAAVSRIKRAMLHAYNIGRSMLRLYSQQMTASA